ncbi:MAG TPA: hypothetical protein PKK74_04280 [Candidatus Methanoculleus thermohydrogenotrophicum]|jgi:hypothetical protein|nr:hypothetical protein [Candidatus Methanoculleus thermohydrogenotrophicum]HPZ38030.1 hypothetical protein [Candidatus Methanoculleus thermohydrogenotrophicum]HQC91282.1 hypothetical protein [Candidatus Methanoculleus thermohydrogenotrophicum]
MVDYLVLRGPRPPPARLLSMQTSRYVEFMRVRLHGTPVVSTTPVQVPKVPFSVSDTMATRVFNQSREMSIRRVSPRAHPLFGPVPGGEHLNWNRGALISRRRKILISYR